MAMLLFPKRQLPPAKSRTRRKAPPTRTRIRTWTMTWGTLVMLLILGMSSCSAAGISYSSNSGNVSTSQRSPGSNPATSTGGLVLIGSSSATSSSVPSLSLTSTSSVGSSGTSSSSGSSSSSSPSSSGSRSGRPTSNPNHDQLPAQLSSRIIHTRNGAISGIIVQLDGRHLDPVEAYRGIPYASPPVGNLRFMPPVSAAMWSGVKKADRWVNLL